MSALFQPGAHFSRMNHNIQLYFALQKRFPQGFDSLLINGTTPAIYSAMLADGTTAATSATANDQATGFPIAGADGSSLNADLAASVLTNATGAEYLRSFTRAGFDWVYDHDRAVVNSNNSATVANKRLLTAAPVNVATVVSGSVLAKKLLPATAGVPVTGTQLVALGVGPNNDMISKTLTNCPIYPGCDGKYYGRYVAVFKVYANGERATLVGVVDSYGRAPDYTQQQFNESLPDGQRQG